MITELKQRCERLKKDAVKADFGVDFKMRKANQIKKTELAKEYVFTENDFQQLSND